jgi:hypothetical protein
MPRFMTLGGPILAAVFTLVTLTGCGDKNIRKLSVGIPRDSVIKILGHGSSATDSTPNVYREERYLNDGHFITMLMYTSTGRKEGADTIDTLTGWGWEHHDSVANANRIVIKPRAK